MKYIISLCLLCCLTLSAFSQLVIRIDEDHEYLKTLEKRLLDANTDSAKAMTAFRLSYMYKKYRNMDLAKQRLEQGVKYAQGNNLLEGIASYNEALYGIGLEDMSKIESKLNRSDSLLKDIQDPEAKKTLSGLWIMRGVLSQLKGNEKGCL